MNRTNIINTIGSSYLVSNIENEEFRYPSAYSEAGIEFIVL